MIAYSPPRPLPPYTGHCPSWWSTYAYIGVETDGHILLEDGSGGLLMEVAIVDMPETPISWEPPEEFLAALDPAVAPTPIPWAPPSVHARAREDAVSHTPIPYQPRSFSPQADDDPVPRIPISR